MALGAVALFVPLAAGRWSLSLLAVTLFASSVVQAYGALTSPQRVTASAYLPSLLTMLAGLLLFFSSALVINGLLLLLIAILAMGGFSKILIAWRADRSYRTAAAVNGFIDLSCAVLLWSLSGLLRVEQAIGIATGLISQLPGGACWRRRLKRRSRRPPPRLPPPTPIPSSVFRRAKPSPACAPRQRAGRGRCSPPISHGC
jgi:hypothetical protein